MNKCSMISALSDFTKDVALIVQEGDLDLETRRHNLNALKVCRNEIIIYCTFSTGFFNSPRTSFTRT